jgi:hypothetical protein
MSAARAPPTGLVRMGRKDRGVPAGGMYLWADFGRDTNELATAGSLEGVLLAPGSLFSPTQLAQYLDARGRRYLSQRARHEVPGPGHATLIPLSLWVEHVSASAPHSRCSSLEAI